MVRAPAIRASVGPQLRTFVIRALAFGLALFGQLRIDGGNGVVLATRCYAAAIVLWLLASPRPGGSGVPLLPKSAWSRRPRRARIRRVIWLETAIAVCFAAVIVLRSRGYDSPGAALAWLASIIALALVFREGSTQRPSGETGERVSAGEVARFLLILVVGAYFPLPQ